MLQKGFTFLELMLVIALLSALAGIGIIGSRYYHLNNYMKIAETNITATLNRAQILSQSQTDDSAWGVHIESGFVRLFQGDDYETRDVQYDQDMPVSTAITLSGDTDIYFAKETGLPSASATITALAQNARTFSINLSEQGLATVTYGS